jgi:two-component system, OmpR family, phosphate regulon sensor histidine kinase PhoR
VLTSIYIRQLDAVLFTVNQYSEDVVRSYAAKINLLPATGLTSTGLYNILKESESLLYAASAGTYPPEDITEVLLDSSRLENFREDFLSVVNLNKDLVDRLYTYYEEGGFQKFEPVIYNGNIHLLFLSDRGIFTCSISFLIPACLLTRYSHRKWNQ